MSTESISRSSCTNGSSSTIHFRAADATKNEQDEVMPPQQTALPTPAVVLSPAEQELEEYHSQRRNLATTDMNRQRRYSAASIDQFPEYVSPRQHVFGQPQLQPLDQFSTGQLQQMMGMGGMPTNRPAFDNMSVVSAMVNNFANAMTLDRLQRNVEDYRQREDQYRERELLDKLTQDITRFGGVYRG